MRVSFSPDNKCIVSGSHDKTVRVWDVTSGEEVKKMDGHGDPVTSVAFSPDNKHIVNRCHKDEDNLVSLHLDMLHDPVTNTFYRIVQKCKLLGRNPVSYPFIGCQGRIAN
eukprot:PhF_6_TR29088/c0_g1_i1/m.42416